MAKVEVYFEELFLHRGFIVTGFQTLSRAEVGFHNKRGVAEQQRIKEPVRVK